MSLRATPSAAAFAAASLPLPSVRLTASRAAAPLRLWGLRSAARARLGIRPAPQWLTPEPPPFGATTATATTAATTATTAAPTATTAATTATTATTATLSTTQSGITR